MDFYVLFFVTLCESYKNGFKGISIENRQLGEKLDVVANWFSIDVNETFHGSNAMFAIFLAHLTELNWRDQALLNTIRLVTANHERMPFKEIQDDWENLKNNNDYRRLIGDIHRIEGHVRHQLID